MNTLYQTLPSAIPDFVDTDAQGRLVLPPLCRSRNGSTRVYNSSIAIPDLSGMMNNDFTKSPNWEESVAMARTHHRRLSGSSINSQSSCSSCESLPSPSRSSSPTSNLSSTFKLVPRAPFPPNIQLSEISAEDALVFFPESTAAGTDGSRPKTRAILLMGPAIAKHIQSAGKRERVRGHPYRITMSAIPQKGQTIAKLLKQQAEEAKQCETGVLSRRLR